MRILLVSPHFYPENFKCNDVAFELVKKGHKVTVLSDIPNYPQGHFFKGYGIFKKRVETVNGVKIIRALVIPRGNGKGGRLILNYLSFALFASIDAFYLALFHKFDAVLVHETSPITVGIPALIVKKIQHLPFYFWVLDLWPESLTAAGGIKNKYILSIFVSIAKTMYRNATKILISSKGFRSSIIEKGNFDGKIVYFPNWAEDIFTDPNVLNNRIPKLPNGFKVMFAGNIGEAQDFEHVMQVALHLRDNKQIHFIIIGDGRKKDWVDNFIKEHSLEETVHMMGRFSIEKMPAFFAQADLMMLSLKDDLIFNLTVPAKLQSYMAVGKPIVAMINGETQNLIEECNCGAYCPAADSRELSEKILYLYNMQPSELDQLGLNGQKYFRSNFSKDICMNKLFSILEKNE